MIFDAKMFEEKKFEYILFTIIIIYALYTIMKNNEGFAECSDNDINLQIFDYVLTKNDDTKNIESFTNNKKKLRRFSKAIKTRRNDAIESFTLNQ